MTDECYDQFNLYVLINEDFDIAAFERKIMEVHYVNHGAMYSDENGDELYPKDVEGNEINESWDEYLFRILTEEGKIVYKLEDTLIGMW